MAQITINNVVYEVPDEVKACMDKLRFDRDWNYRMAQDQQKRLQKAITVIKTIKGLSTMRRIKNSNQKSLFK